MADPISLTLAVANLAVQTAGAAYPVYVNTDSTSTTVDKTDSLLAILSKTILDLKKSKGPTSTELKSLTDELDLLIVEFNKLSQKKVTWKDRLPFSKYSRRVQKQQANCQDLAKSVCKTSIKVNYRLLYDQETNVRSRRHSIGEYSEGASENIFSDSHAVASGSSGASFAAEPSGRRAYRQGTAEAVPLTSILTSSSGPSTEPRSTRPGVRFG